MRICECCGQLIPDVVTRYGLMVTLSPPSMSYNGRKLIGFGRTKIEMMWHLVKNGRASYETMSHRPHGEPARLDTIKAQASMLRALLKENHVNVRIIAIHGWGYILQHYELQPGEKPPLPRVAGRDAAIIIEMFKDQNKED